MQLSFSGQALQLAAGNLNRMDPFDPKVPVTLTLLGQVAMRLSRSIANSLLGKPPVELRSGGLFDEAGDAFFLEPLPRGSRSVG